MSGTHMRTGHFSAKATNLVIPRMKSSGFYRRSAEALRTNCQQVRSPNSFQRQSLNASSNERSCTGFVHPSPRLCSSQPVCIRSMVYLKHISVRGLRRPVNGPQRAVAIRAVLLGDVHGPSNESVASLAPHVHELRIQMLELFSVLGGMQSCDQRWARLQELSANYLTTVDFEERLPADPSKPMGNVLISRVKGLVNKAAKSRADSTSPERLLQEATPELLAAVGRVWLRLSQRDDALSWRGATLAKMASRLAAAQEKDSKPPTFIQIVSVAFSLTTVVPANDTPKEVSRLVTCLCCKVKASILGVEDQTPLSDKISADILKVLTSKRWRLIDVPCRKRDAKTTSMAQTKLGTDRAMQQLHHDILALCKAIDHQVEQEREPMSQVQSDTTTCVQLLFPRGNVDLFGSQLVGLALPGADMDLVVSGPDTRRAIATNAHLVMAELSDLLERRGVALPGSFVPVPHAKTPLLKFGASLPASCRASLAVDLAFVGADDRGVESADWMRRQMEARPELRPLCLTLKALLRQNALGDSSLGGLGSYALVNMVVHSLEHHPVQDVPRAKDGSPNGLGKHLLDFLSLYGRNFDYARFGLDLSDPSLQNRSVLLRKANWKHDYGGPPGARGVSRKLLHVRDPLQPWNDLGAPTWMLDGVQRCFSRSADTLTLALDRRNSGKSRWSSLLGPILCTDMHGLPAETTPVYSAAQKRVLHERKRRNRRTSVSTRTLARAGISIRDSGSSIAQSQDARGFGDSS